MSNKPSRRAVVRTGVWSVPAVAIATAAPAAANHSGPVTIPLSSAIYWKCPGKARGRVTNYPKTTIFTLAFGQVVNTLLVTDIEFRGVQHKVKDIVHDCDPKVWHVIFETDQNSRHGDGVLSYVADGIAATTPVLPDNHPFPHRYPCYGDC